MIAVSLPGFVLAMLTARLRDPRARGPGVCRSRASLRELQRRHQLAGSGICSHWSSSLVAGSVVALYFDRVYGADSKVDVAAFGATVAWAGPQHSALGQTLRHAPASGPTTLVRVFGEQAVSLAVVLRTPTLVYMFLGGALISFGMNGLVGWAPTFMSRELKLAVTHAAALLGTLGTGRRGSLARSGRWESWRTGSGAIPPTGRVVTVVLRTSDRGAARGLAAHAAGHELFVPVFAAAFFFLSWFNGPIAAVIFDVVPAKISATVAGAYLLFIHLVGDTVAIPAGGRALGPVRAGSGGAGLPP